MILLAAAESASSMSGLLLTLLIILGISVSIAVPVVFRIITMNIAVKKGYTGKWFLFGFFCTLVGLIVACAIHPNGEKPVKASMNSADAIKQYKELLDQGAITEEEYNKKKAELLN